MDTTPKHKIRPWVIALILLCALQPLLIYGIQQVYQPEGMVPTGLSIPDSALFLHSMDAFPEMDSAYANQMTGASDMRWVTDNNFYSVPHLWLYVVLGIFTDSDNRIAYEALNCVGAFFLLLVVYQLLTVLVPKHSDSAFCLYLLSGGLGGLHFLLAHFAGWFDDPAYADGFLRMWVYGLAEGPHLNPFLIFPRAYYTLSMAGCLWGLHQLIRHPRGTTLRTMILTGCVLVVATFLNARFGLFTLGLMTLYSLLKFSKNEGVSTRGLYPLVFPILFGAALSFLLMQQNQTSIDNHLQVANMAMWFGPFVMAALLHLIIALPQLHRIKTSSPWAQLLLRLGLYYAWAYAFCYLLHQLYYGGLGQFIEGVVATAVSDPALLMALIATVIHTFITRKKEHTPTQSTEQVFVALWLLGLGALSISAFGQGAFLQFGPQRMQVFLWLPLSILTAQGLAQLKSKLKQGTQILLYSGGISSILVATIVFQAGLGTSPCPGLRTQWMMEADGKAIEYIGKGKVIAPSPMSDVIVQQKGNEVFFGIASFNLTHKPYIDLRTLNDEFFHPETTDRDRLLYHLRVDWVVCSETWPVDAATLKELDGTPWLENVYSEGNSRVYGVHRELVRGVTRKHGTGMPTLKKNRKPLRELL